MVSNFNSADTKRIPVIYRLLNDFRFERGAAQVFVDEQPPVDNLESQLVGTVGDSLKTLPEFGDLILECVIVMA